MGKVFRTFVIGKEYGDVSLAEAGYLKHVDAIFGVHLNGVDPENGRVFTCHSFLLPESFAYRKLDRVTDASPIQLYLPKGILLEGSSPPGNAHDERDQKNYQEQEEQNLRASGRGNGDSTEAKNRRHEGN